MENLKISISGIRGQYSTGLTKETIINFMDAYVSFLGGKIKKGLVIGRDTRISGPEIYKLIYNHLKSKKIKVILLGIVPTPTVQLAVRHHKTAGGIIITASHNPKGDNGLKFLSEKGIFLIKNEIDKVIKRYNVLNKKDFKYKFNLNSLNKKEKNIEDKNQKEIIKNHINKIKNIIDVRAIKKRKFKVVIDACNGAGTSVVKLLSENFGFKLIGLHMKPQGNFERSPEPIPENLKKLGEIVKETKADIGFAQDPDADRLAIVNDMGEPIGEDNTLVLAVDQYLRKNKKKGLKVATNLSTSQAVDDVAKKYNAKIYRTPIGEINVVKTMIAKKVDIGGEGNGGVILPKVGYGRDSLCGIGLILEFLASTNKKLSEKLKEFPKYIMIKDKIKVISERVIQKGLIKIKKEFKDNKIDMQDGIKIIFNNSWLHVRASNTEPIVRFIAEAPTFEKAKSLINKAKEIFN